MKKYILLLIVSFLLFTTNSYSQYTGATPWADCYGKNIGCDYYGCSNITVITSPSEPVVAIVKKNDRIIKHAYISKNSSYTFELKNGTYQVFFYYGENWVSNLYMPSDDCNLLTGGWSLNASVSKDDPITLKNQAMEYTLTLRSSGNFTPDKSSLKEVF
tara:strand:- start:1724 stop:2200 length:477 start_codon:yes stop_codon:yes gene_type:complete